VLGKKILKRLEGMKWKTREVFVMMASQEGSKVLDSTNEPISDSELGFA
jgi:hypothetical protein